MSSHPGASRLRLTTLDALSPEVRRALERIAQVRSWSANEVLHRAGDVVGSALVCDEGRLRVARSLPDGVEHLSRGVCNGEFLALPSAIGGQPFCFTVTAVGRCRTRHFPAAALRALMRADGQVAFELARCLAERIQELWDVMVDEHRERVDERLSAVLLRLGKVMQGARRPDGVELRISQADLASMVGSSRQYVNLQLRRFQQMGRIRLGYRTIVLLDRAAWPIASPGISLELSTA